MLRFFVLVGAGGVAHAAPSCTYSRLAQATHTPTPRALPNQTASVPTGPEASGVRRQLEEHPLRHGGRGEAPCRIFFRALGPATQTPLERGDAEGLENKNALSDVLLDSVYGRKYRTLCVRPLAAQREKEGLATFKQAFSKSATSKYRSRKEGTGGGTFDPPEGQNARRFFDWLEGLDARRFFDGANVGCESTTNAPFRLFDEAKVGSESTTTCSSASRNEKCRSYPCTPRRRRQEVTDARLVSFECFWIECDSRMRIFFCKKVDRLSINALRFKVCKTRQTIGRNEDSTTCHKQSSVTLRATSYEEVAQVSRDERDSRSRVRRSR